MSSLYPLDTAPQHQLCAPRYWPIVQIQWYCILIPNNYWYRCSGPLYFWPILLVAVSNGLNVAYRIAYNILYNSRHLFWFNRSGGDGHHWLFWWDNHCMRCAVKIVDSVILSIRMQKLPVLKKFAVNLSKECLCGLNWRNFDLNSCCLQKLACFQQQHPW